MHPGNVWEFINGMQCSLVLSLSLGMGWSTSCNVLGFVNGCSASWYYLEFATGMGRILVIVLEFATGMERILVLS